MGQAWHMIKATRRKEERHLMPTQGTGWLAVFMVASGKTISIGRRTHLWNLSKKGGCVFSGNFPKFKVGDQVTLRVYSDCLNEEYTFQAVIRWIDQVWFGFEFASIQDAEWAIKYLPSMKFGTNSQRLLR